jgi:hypothetical protein
MKRAGLFRTCNDGRGIDDASSSSLAGTPKIPLPSFFTGAMEPKGRSGSSFLFRGNCVPAGGSGSLGSAYLGTYLPRYLPT